MGIFDHHDNDQAAATTTFGSAAASTTASTTGSSTTWTCPALPTPINDADPIAGSLTFHKLSGYICIAFAAVAIAVSALLIFRHAIHLSQPREQIKIMRLTALVPVFAVMSVGNSYLGISSIYLVPWMDFFESISLINFFFLIRAYLAEARIDDSAFINNINEYNPSSKQNFGGNAEPPKPPPPAPKVRFLATQYIFIALFCSVLTDITQAAGKYCLNSNNFHFAHLWIELIKTISVGAAVVAILRFTSGNKHHIAQHKPMLKLVAFKLIVFLQFVQSLIFSYAGAHIKTSTKISYVDITVQIPALITGAEMVIFAVAFHFVFRAKPYERTSRSHGLHYQGGPLGVVALFTAFNPFSVVMDIIEGY